MSIRIKTTITWRQWPWDKPKFSEPVLVAVEEPGEHMNPSIIQCYYSEAYGNGKFRMYETDEKVRNVYAWAPLPAAPDFTEKTDEQ